LEGFLVVEVGANPHSLTSLELDDIGKRHPGLDSACRPAPAEVPECHNLVAGVQDLREVEVGRGEKVLRLKKKLAHGFSASIRLIAPSQRQPRVPLHVWIEDFQHLLEVATVGRLKSALERLHVLLRHRPRSISLPARLTEP
jgi:hypothetical protein